MPVMTFSTETGNKVILCINFTSIGCTLYSYCTLKHVFVLFIIVRKLFLCYTVIRILHLCLFFIHIWRFANISSCWTAAVLMTQCPMYVRAVLHTTHGGSHVMHYSLALSRCRCYIITNVTSSFFHKQRKTWFNNITESMNIPKQNAYLVVSFTVLKLFIHRAL